MIHEVLDKLPDEHAIRAIRLDQEAERRLRAASRTGDERPTRALPDRPSGGPAAAAQASRRYARLPSDEPLGRDRPAARARDRVQRRSLGFLYKHRGAVESPAVELRRPVRSSLALFRSRWYTLGIVDRDRRRWGLHVAALSLAPISLVQSVIAGGLVLLTVTADRLFAHTSPGASGSASALAAARPRVPRGDARGHRRRAPTPTTRRPTGRLLRRSSAPRWPRGRRRPRRPRSRRRCSAPRPGSSGPPPTPRSRRSASSATPALRGPRPARWRW